MFINTQFIIALVLAFSLTIFLIFLLQKPAKVFNLTDIPDGKRKNHLGKIPLIGGPCIFIGFILSFLILDVALDSWKIFLACIIITLLVGLLDDLLDIEVSLRIISQILIGTLMLSSANVGIFSFGDIFGTGKIDFFFWALPLTILAVLSSKNALNMMDGIDGLAALIALTSLLSLLIIATINYKYTYFQIISIQIVAILPFLLSNLIIFGRNRQVFLGDSGSTYLGFVILWFMIIFSQGEHAIMRPVTALWIFAIPLFDMTSTTLRRLLKNQLIFEADKQHLHHLLLDLGYDKKKALISISVVNALMAIIGILGEIYLVKEVVLFFSIISLFIVYLYFTNIWYKNHIKRLKI